MNTAPMDPLDQILARSAPPAAAEDPALDAGIGALAAESRAAASARRRWRPGAVVAGAAVVLVGVVGAGAVAAVQERPVEAQPFMEPAEPWASDATRIEWLYTDPAGYRCVMRLTGFDLTDTQIAHIRTVLSDPDGLVAADDGVVRQEFLARYDDSEGKQELATREEYVSMLDTAYAEVRRLDLAAGSSALDGVPLTSTITDEDFGHAYTRLVLDGLESPQLDPLRDLTPESACEVGE